MAESNQKKLSRVRKPRVHITYDVETEGAEEKVELPFVVGVLVFNEGATTEKLDNGVLVVFGLAVGGFGIDDGPQQRFVVPALGSKCRVFRQISCFFRIVHKIEQFGPVSDVVIKLVAALAQHEPAGRRRAGVIFAERNPVGINRRGCYVKQRPARQVARRAVWLLIRIDPRRIDDGRVDIHQ